MNKRTVLCFLVFALCVFYSSMLNPAFAQDKLLAQQVFRKHNRTLQRADVQEVLPQVLEGLKAPETQARLNPRTINAVVANPDLLLFFIPDIEPRFVALLKRDQELKNFLRDPLVQRLLQRPAAIDELAGLLGIGAEFQPPMSSVVWIATYSDDERGIVFGKGSGVLIDKARRLVVTNEHVVGNVALIAVFFPYRDRNGRLIKNEGFYFENWEWLDRLGYHTDGRVVAKNVRNDLAIIQLDHLPATTREIKHDFTRNIEDSMRQGDKVHILGNPGQQLWHWIEGTFVGDGRNCLPSRGDCLVMKAGARGGNSGGPVLNGQGTLIGILTAGDGETLSSASPARNVKALLKTLRPRHAFRIRNLTGFTVPYEIKWTHNHNWKQQSVRARGGWVHWLNRDSVPQGYPKIRFDNIAGKQRGTYQYYTLETSWHFGDNTDGAPTYVFRYNRWGNRLDLFRDRDAAAAPALSKFVPEENALFANYPNPFNPETWIPYQLAKPAEVKVAIYAVDGTLVRTLSLGHQAAGVYRSKGRAAYWDGTNALGEPVASGVYFYTLKVAGEFTSTRKMLIQK